MPRRFRSLALRFLRRVKPLKVVRFGEFNMMMDLRDFYIGAEVLVDGTWEPHLQRIVRALPLVGRVAIDAGAHIGLYSVLLSRLTGPAGRVIALEPESRNFEFLHKNVSLNSASNVHLIRAAAGSQAGQANIALNPVNHGDHRVVHADDGIGTCTVVTLDSLASDLARDSVGFVKIDVQGSELEVLRGMSRLIEANPHLVIQLEVCPGTAVEAIRMLQAWGFDGYEVRRAGASPISTAERFEGIEDETDLVVARDSGWLGEVIRTSGG